VKVTASTTLTHNPCGEADWASGLRENLTSRSYGEGLETGPILIQAPRQSFTRQVVIKRYKSLLGAAKVRAKQESPLAMVYLLGKLLFALLVERRAMARLGNEWTQMLTVRVATWWRVWNLLAQELHAAVLDTVRWSEWDWRAVLRALAERPRHRKLQILPPAVADWLRSTPLAPLRLAA
jgi:hypothetical protein